MADDLALATVVVACIAIVLTLSPTSLGFLARTFSTIVRAVWPGLGHCEALGWDSIPNGRLHECTVPSASCRHLGVLGSKRSWDHTIGSFFTVIKRGTFVRKPTQLSLFTTYIRTDKKTLRVFLSLLRPRDIRLVLENVGGITTAYIVVPHDIRLGKGRLDLTKEEMDLLLCGYPPWYKHPLPLLNNRSVLHPIKNADDILRGGWIIAIGFSKIDPIASNFMEFRIGRISRILRFVAVEQAFNRVLHCLGNLTKAFPNEDDARSAYKLMTAVLDYLRDDEDKANVSMLGSIFQHSDLGTNLGRWFYPYPSKGPVDFTLGLTDNQVITAMEVFNHYDPLSGDEIKDLRPVLQSVLLGALTGVYFVCWGLLRDLRSKEEFLPELIGDGFIYLRERWPNSED